MHYTAASLAEIKVSRQPDGVWDYAVRPPVARLAQATGAPFGLLNPLLYRPVASPSMRSGFRDITVGNNGGYAAKTGWDACTGLGVPDGEALLTRLSASARA